ncbi:hypothetical protein ACLRDC_01430 [Gluconacetobacter sacchari]|uniref:Uncharacterized protein n=2 Tax=Gluconacetobacter sacchari TaxID=92759 RepID=A0A7W4NL87_9PROT|nr:hypothetical protein [Gluconacetobacter sacchari]MBB2159854.1 hypothetical protein [Gluconacetobacter sacchari]GBQ24335.1 hypothetical protein AA12717_1753 [Gluconacetobacter sacchari DSM 12717]
MFVIESWPDAADKAGLRVVASTDTRIVANVLTPFPDLVVWARTVPETWSDFLSRNQEICAPLALAGSPDHLLSRWRNQDLLPKTLSFLKDDIEQTLALTTALGPARFLRVTWHPVTGSFAPILAAGAPLRTLCLYGEGTQTFFHEDGTRPGSTVSPDPYALVFCRAGLPVSLKPEFHAAHKGACFVLMIEGE